MTKIGRCLLLLDISKQYPSAAIFRRNDNGGQTLAAQEGFNARTGEYVVFLDADGVLLPEFIATHIFIHLSLRISGWLTSADVLQTVESRIVFGTYFTLSDMCARGAAKDRTCCNGLMNALVIYGRCIDPKHRSRDKFILLNQVISRAGTGRPCRPIAFAGMRFGFL